MEVKLKEDLLAAEIARQLVSTTVMLMVAKLELLLVCGMLD